MSDIDTDELAWTIIDAVHLCACVGDELPEQVDIVRGILDEALGRKPPAPAGE